MSAVVGSEFKKTCCLGCSLGCDDVLINAVSKSIKFAGGICELGRNWFQHQSEGTRGCSLSGRKESLEAATQAAANLLRVSRNPLVCGLNHLSLSEVQRLAQLACRLKGTIDIGLTSTADGHSEAFRQLGLMTASLGQVASSTTLGLLIDWQPERTHPRFLERFGKSFRSLWRLDIQSGPTISDSADTEVNHRTVQFPDESRLLSWLRSFEERMDENASATCESRPVPPGSSPDSDRLFEDLKSAEGVALIVGPKVAKHKLLSELVTGLARKLNEQVKTYLLFAPTHPATVAESVLTWMFGFPNAVNLNSGYPQWNRDEYSAANTLLRGSADCLLICGNDPAPFVEMEGLARNIPIIALHSSSLPITPSVSIAVQQCGWDGAGEWMRMDEMLLRVEPVYQGNRPNLIQVIQLLEQTLG